jgi:hypothetical protein
LRNYANTGFQEADAKAILETYGQYIVATGVYGGYIELRSTITGGAYLSMEGKESSARQCYEWSVSAEASGFGFSGSAGASQDKCEGNSESVFQTSRGSFQEDTQEQTTVGGSVDGDEFIVTAQTATLLTTKDKYPQDPSGIALRPLVDFLSIEKISPLEVNKHQIAEEQFVQIQENLAAYTIKYLSDIGGTYDACDCGENGIPYFQEDESGSRTCDCY